MTEPVLNYPATALTHVLATARVSIAALPLDLEVHVADLEDASIPLLQAILRDGILVHEGKRGAAARCPRGRHGRRVSSTSASSGSPSGKQSGVQLSSAPRLVHSWA